MCLGDQNKRMLAALGEMETSGAKKLMEAVAESRPLITSALRVSRVLIGQCGSKYMELFRVDSGRRIEHLHRITITSVNESFAATVTCVNDILVAMTYKMACIE